MSDIHNREEVIQVKGTSFTLASDEMLGKKRLRRIRKQLKNMLINIVSKKMQCQIVRARDGNNLY